jgi:hypothetical protein
MKRTQLLSALLTMLFLAAVVGVVAQTRRITELRQEKRHLVFPEDLPEPDPPGVAPSPNAELVPVDSSRELLRLRAEVTRLSQQRRSLLSVSNEYQRLNAQLASRRVPEVGSALPPGYLRTSQAKLVGYATPEDTLQSIMWAISHQDVTNLVKGLAPAEAQKFQSQMSANEFFRDTSSFIGASIKERYPMADGSVELMAELVPGLPAQRLRFLRIDGEWKLKSFP